jgi:anaerobic selenocysteine-containing dehydrogenase
VLGLLVESQDGRPTKVEGNPRHPNSSGATDMWAQGSVLNLYDPDRCRVPHRLGADGKHTASDWDTVTEELGATLKDLRDSQGAGLALVLPTVRLADLPRHPAHLQGQVREGPHLHR